MGNGAERQTSRPPGLEQAHMLMMARSTPRLRVSLPNAAPAEPAGMGRSSEATTSPAAARLAGPDEELGQRHAPLTRWTCDIRHGTVDQEHGHGVGGGDALQTFPTSVARLRIWIEPTTAAASSSAGNQRRIRSSPRSVVM